jgi:TolB protein
VVARRHSAGLRPSAEQPQRRPLQRAQERNGLTRLTRTSGSEANPVWSPAGGRIAFEYGEVISGFEIVVIDADGTDRTALTTNHVADLEPVWAPGGRRIAFTRFVTGSNSEIFSVHANGTGLERLTSTRFEEHHPDWSSTGKIAFVRFRASTNDLVVMNGDGSGKRVIWRSRDIVAASWSPDGSRLAVEFWDGNDHELFSVSAAGNTRRRLTRNDVDDSGPVWSPNGARIGFTRFARGSNDV